MSLMLIIQFLVLTFIISGVLIFFLKKVLFDSTQGAVNRLNRETEEVRHQQEELKEKIKQANEELERRRKEADELVARMTAEAEEKAKEARDKMLNKARQDGEEILAKAQRTKEEMKKVVEKEAILKTVDFTAEVLNTVLSKKSAEALQECLIMDFIQELGKVNMDAVTQVVDEVGVITVFPLKDQHRQKIVQILKERLQKDVKIKSSEDPKIISGIIVRLGSLALDWSLRNMVREETLSIKERIEKS